MLSRIRRILEKQPGAKGREIAAHAGLERSEVNQFLHRHKEVFRQDGDYRWFLVSPKELRIEFTGAHWLTSRDFEDALCRYSSPLDSECGSVVFVLKDECKMMIEALARMLALSNQLVSAGKEVKLNFEASRMALSYLDRLGFFDLLSDRIVVLPRRPKGSLAKAYRGNNDGVIEFRTIDPGDPDEETPRLLAGC